LKYILAILFILIVGSAQSQISIGYSIGVFGENLKIDSYSNPLAITSTTCIQVTNGVAKFLISGKGIYLNACAVKETDIKLNILVAPNPATEFTVVKFGTKLQNQERFNIQLFNAAGQLVQKHVTTQSQLLTGFKIATGNLPQGIYFIKVFSSSINEVVKIIKN
jgi:hypothetical protein